MTEAIQLAFEMLPGVHAELAGRIAAARKSGALSECEAAVLDILASRTGRGSAIQISQVQSSWRIAGKPVWCDRSIKAAVKALIEEHAIPVCSLRGQISGYFLAVRSEDLEAAERPLRGEIISLAKRLRAFNPKSDFARHLAGQLQIAAPSGD